MLVSDKCPMRGGIEKMPQLDHRPKHIGGVLDCMESGGHQKAPLGNYQCFQVNKNIAKKNDSITIASELNYKSVYYKFIEL